MEDTDAKDLPYGRELMMMMIYIYMMMMKGALPEGRSAVLSVTPDLQHLVLCPKAGSPAVLFSHS